MRDLEESIAEWRQTMSAAPNIGPDILDELETHLRETVEQIVRSGLSEADAFQRAVTQFGPPEKVASEFCKLKAFGWWPARIVTAVGLTAALMLALGLGFHPPVGRQEYVLLVAHILAVTFGYGTTLLLGVLGVCFVIQRCYSDFSPRRLQALSRVTRNFARVGAVLIVLGTVLGMLWSHRVWGRYWGWEAKEIGALCTALWLLGYLAAHRSKLITAHGLFVGSLIGSNVVLLAWFGPNLFLGHTYGISVHGSWLLVVALTINLVFFLVGLAPAGWLRLRRA